MNNDIIIRADYGAYKKRGWGHSKTHIRYHIIFSTKYRRKCLNEIKNDVIKCFVDCAERSDFNIYNINLDKDHVHMLVEVPPTLKISSCVSRLKQISTNELYRNPVTAAWLKHFYWGKKKKLWTHGYFCSTIGLVSETIVWNYINSQGQH